MGVLYNRRHTQRASRVRVSEVKGHGARLDRMLSREIAPLCFLALIADQIILDGGFRINWDARD